MQITENHSPCWYVVAAREGSLDRARLHLAVAGLTIWAPVDVKRSPDRSRSGLPRRDIRIPRFGRYLFVRCPMSAGLAQAIDHTAGVAGLLRAPGTDEPSPVPARHIEWLQAEKAPEKPASPFAAGDRVRFREGPFTGHEAIVRGVDKRGALHVEVELFGRPSPIVIEAGHVEITQQAKSRVIQAFKSHRAGSRSGAAAMAR